MMMLCTETATVCGLTNTRWQVNTVWFFKLGLLMYGKGKSSRYSCFPFLHLGWCIWDLAGQEDQSRKEHTFPLHSLNICYCQLGWEFKGITTPPLINGKSGLWKQVTRSSLKICPSSCILPHNLLPVGKRGPWTKGNFTGLVLCLFH